MATKIAGEYIAELQVEFDKKSQAKQGKQLFTQHVSNLHKQNQHTIKESEKTAEKSTEASFKGTEKGIKKRGGFRGLIRLLSKASLVFNKTLSKIPYIGGLLTPIAIGGRFLSYDPKSTFDSITNVTGGANQSLDYSNLLGIDPAKLVKKVDDLIRMGLTKESAMGLISSTSRRIGSNNIDDISSYINMALDSFKNQDNLLSKEVVAKAYNLSPNTLAQLQTYEQLSKGGTIPIITPVVTPTTKELQTESGFNIAKKQEDINKDSLVENEVIKEVNTKMTELLKNINDVNMIDLARLSKDIEMLDTQVRGYTATKKIGIGLDTLINSTIEFGKEANITKDSLKDLTKAVKDLLVTLNILGDSKGKNVKNLVISPSGYLITQADPTMGK